MIMNLKTGDLVAYAVFKKEPRYRLGIVIKINYTMGLAKIKWCDGHVSLHSEMFLKRIA